MTEEPKDAQAAADKPASETPASTRRRLNIDIGDANLPLLGDGCGWKAYQCQSEQN